jgi:S-(hydroxymethyl)glutathione dehydrogenase/alcohol dehydrogenase
MCAGVGSGEMLGEAFWLGGKGGKIVVTNIHPTSEQTVNLPMALFTLLDRKMFGTIFGSGNGRADVPKLMELYTQGQLQLDDVVTRTYSLDQINEAFDAMRNAENVRGVITF